MKKRLFSVFKLFSILVLLVFSSCSGIFEPYSTCTVSFNLSCSRDAGGIVEGEFENKILYAYINGRHGYSDEVVVTGKKNSTIIFENVPVGYYEVYVNVYDIPEDWIVEGELKEINIDKLHELKPVLKGFGSQFVKASFSATPVTIYVRPENTVFSDFEALAAAWNGVIADVKLGKDVPETVEYTVNGNFEMTCTIEVGYFRKDADSPVLYTPNLVLKTESGAFFTVGNQGFTAIDRKLTFEGLEDSPIIITEADDTAVVLDGTGELECSYVNFETNVTEDGPGAIELNGESSLICNNVSFTHNESDGGEGGAVFVMAKSRAQFKDCYFAHNKADLGGAVAVQSDEGVQSNPHKNLTLEDCTFENNSAFYGGALYTAGTGDFLVSVKGNSVLKDNQATECGGAIYLDGGNSSLHLTGTDSENQVMIINNSLDLRKDEELVLADPIKTTYGAGIFVNSGNIVFDNVNVNNNYVLTINRTSQVIEDTNPIAGKVNGYCYDLYLSPDAKIVLLQNESYVHTIICEYTSEKDYLISCDESFSSEGMYTPMILAAYSKDDAVFDEEFEGTPVLMMLGDFISTFDLSKTTWPDYETPFVFADINYWDAFWPAGVTDPSSYVPEKSWSFDGLYTKAVRN